MRVRIAVIVPLLIASLVGCDTTDNRQAEVAERGGHVMPFDLDQTMHHFQPKPEGGVQKVVIKEGADQAQLAKIRRHLRHEAERFQEGNFSDPARIHGEDMPGLQTLAANADHIDISYSDLSRGGQIRYRSDDPQLVHAIHRWFQAQSHDHGEHATTDAEHSH